MRIRQVLRGDERGEVAAIEMMTVVGFLLLPALVFLIQIPRWVDAKSTAELAAQEAARQVVLAPDLGSGYAAGTAIAREIVVNHGFDGDTLQAVTFSIDPPGDPAPGTEATVTATVRMATPAIVMPFVGTLPLNTSNSYTGEHVEFFDVFRES